MSQAVLYRECPACKSTSVKPVLDAKDYTVSQESFSVWHCDACTLRFTQNAPSSAFIGRYYQSENYVSHSDTKRGIINRLYHSVRNITLVQKRKLVQKATGLQQGSLLDIGAGTGAFANTMKESGWQVTALEPDDTAREVARKNYNLTLQLPEELFNQPAQSLDAITMWHVLEHVHELHRYLQTFHLILRQHGVLVIAVPNYTSYDAVHYKEYWAAYDVPRHLYHFSPQSMKQLLSLHHFELRELNPMPFDSFYVSILSEKYRTGANNLAGAFLTGLKSNLAASGKPGKSSSVIYIAVKK